VIVLLLELELELVAELLDDDLQQPPASVAFSRV
jgi:hypothetical protein